MSGLLLRVHRLLLRLIAPGDLVREYGDEIELVFSEMLDAASRRGRVEIVRVWCREVAQLFGTVRRLSQGVAAARAARPGAVRASRREHMLTDLRLAAIGLTRRPLFAGSVALTLAAGLGLTAAVYAVSRASILAEPPVPDPDRVVIVTGKVESPEWTGRTGMSARELLALGEHAQLLENLSVFSLAGTMTLTGGARSVRLRADFVGPSFFELLGGQALLGRVFGSAERRTPEVPNAVLAFHAWQRHFGEDPDIVGQQVELAGVPYTVIGVMPGEYWGLDRSPRATDVWLPLGRSPDAHGPSVLTSLGNAMYWGVGRMRPHASIESVAVELDRLHGELSLADPPPTPRDAGVIGLREYFYGGAQRSLAAVALGAVLVLAVCGVNLAFLIGLRARERSGELAIRSALGSSSVRLLQTVMSESLLLALLGGAAGVALAHVSVEVFLWRFGDSLLRFEQVSVDAPLVGGIFLMATVLTALPALASARITRSAASRGAVGVAHRRTGRSGLIVATETTLAVVVVIAMALSARSLRQLRGVDIGYDAEGLQSVRMNLEGSAHDEAGGPARFVRSLHERLSSMPGLEAGIMGPDMMGRSVTHVHMTPLGLDPQNPDNVYRVQWISVTPGTFEALGMELTEGRDVSWSDARGDATAAVVSEATARRLWPRESALGKRFHLGQSAEANAVVVGVTRGARHVSRYGGGYVVGDVYFPFAQRPTPRVSLLFRSTGRTRVELADVDHVVESIDERVALFDASPMQSRLRGEETGLRLVLALSAIYALIAVLLVLCGMVAVVATAVHQRRGELAVRSALGARRGALLWALMRGTVGALVVGVASGSVLAVAATEPLARVFYGISHTDPLTYALVATGLAVVGVLAAWIPARRIADIAPAEVMRTS